MVGCFNPWSIKRTLDVSLPNNRATFNRQVFCKVNGVVKRLRLVKSGDMSKLLPSRPDKISSPMRLCLMVAQTGPAGLWSPSAVAAAELAVDEVNQQGGILGREIEIFVRDCGPDATTAAQNSLALGAEALIGMFPSYARADVAETLGGRIPFLYTPQFEGNERSADIITTGETTEDLLRTALNVLGEKRSVRKVFLCGSRYRWPQESFAIARRLIAEAGGEVVGEHFNNLEDEDYELLIEKIRESRADTVVPMFLGLDSVAFNRAFAAEGLSGRVARCIPGFDETMLYSLSPDETENLFTVSSYFAGHRSANNGAFLERYYTRFGATPPPINAYGQSVYEGIYTLAALMENSQSSSLCLLRQGLGQVLPRRSARNGRGMRPVGTRASVLVAEAQGYDLNIIASGDLR
ncbi:substrate-binding domain-containing protein (plasmid) [Thioclava sp. 'Guangxiensis']|uniref:substrate-binding domain-containing protein n=1 Tax=Thioclava sp. 'Guangxiensis' TaxID=3149044 RepID=UPI0038783C0C